MLVMLSFLSPWVPLPEPRVMVKVPVPSNYLILVAMIAVQVDVLQSSRTSFVVVTEGYLECHMDPRR
eukprot:4086854-Pyramimonas_sp.AAC.1